MSGEQRTEHIENTNKILKLAPLLQNGEVHKLAVFFRVYNSFC